MFVLCCDQKYSCSALQRWNKYIEANWDEFKSEARVFGRRFYLIIVFLENVLDFYKQVSNRTLLCFSIDFAYGFILLFHRWDYSKANQKALQEGAERVGLKLNNIDKPNKWEWSYKIDEQQVDDFKIYEAEFLCTL